MGFLGEPYETSQGTRWWWLVGVTPQQLAQAANQWGARTYQVKGYPTPQGTRYHALFLGNIDEETRRVHEAAGSMHPPPG